MCRRHSWGVIHLHMCRRHSWGVIHLQLCRRHSWGVYHLHVCRSWGVIHLHVCRRHSWGLSTSTCARGTAGGLSTSTCAGGTAGGSPPPRVHAAQLGGYPPPRVQELGVHISTHHAHNGFTSPHTMRTMGSHLRTPCAGAAVDAAAGGRVLRHNLPNAGRAGAILGMRGEACYDTSFHPQPSTTSPLVGMAEESCHIRGAMLGMPY